MGNRWMKGVLKAPDGKRPLSPKGGKPKELDLKAGVS